MTQDDIYFLKLVSGGWTPQRICSRLQITPAQFEEKFSRLVAAHQSQLVNGHAALIAFAGVFASQYMQLGESMKLIAMSIDNQVTEAELVAIGITVEQARKVMSAFIVLRPFSLEAATKAVDDYVQKAQSLATGVVSKN